MPRREKDRELARKRKRKKERRKLRAKGLLPPPAEAVRKEIVKEAPKKKEKAPQKEVAPPREAAPPKEAPQEPPEKVPEPSTPET